MASVLFITVLALIVSNLVFAGRLPEGPYKFSPYWNRDVRLAATLGSGHYGYHFAYGELKRNLPHQLWELKYTEDEYLTISQDGLYLALLDGGSAYPVPNILQNDIYEWRMEWKSTEIFNLKPHYLPRVNGVQNGGVLHGDMYSSVEWVPVSYILQDWDDTLVDGWRLESIQEAAPYKHPHKSQLPLVNV